MTTITPRRSGPTSDLRAARRVARRAPVLPAPKVALLATLVVGIAIRAWHVLGQDFPLNDGGLFYQMARDLQAAHYRLPATTTYNGLGIPFGYSPLAFYLAALLDAWTPLTLLEAFRWLPLAASAATLGAFALLAGALLRSPWRTVAAVAAFAVVPRSFIWLVMGGGVTRALGLLFALLALHQLHRLYARREASAIVPAGVLAALTAASHLGTAPFVAFSALLLLLATGRHRLAVLGSAGAALVAAVLAAPWWASVLARHGTAPFEAAFATGGSIFRGLTLESALWWVSHFGLGTAEPVLAVVGMLAVLGLFVSLARGRWHLPAWWLAIVVLDARQGSTFAQVPVAMLAAAGLADVLLPALRSARVRLARDRARRELLPTVVPLQPRIARAELVLLGVLAAFAAGSALLRTPSVAGGLYDMRALTPAERDAMGWVATSLPAASRVLVVAESAWEVDKHSEWLPVLGRRQSVATVQGWEWIAPAGAFARKKREFIDLQGCGRWDERCLDQWAGRWGASFTHVYLPRVPHGACCRQLRQALDHAPGYVRVYDGAGASIYARRAQAVVRRVPAAPRRPG